MAYRIKATVNYTWNLEKILDQVVDLFQNDTTFHKMQEILAHSLMNAFGSTHAD